MNEAIGPASEWGLVGSATTNGWDGPDMRHATNQVADQYGIYAQLVAGEMKFRIANEWGLNLGDNDANGSLEEGGANIAVPEDGCLYIDIRQSK